MSTRLEPLRLTHHVLIYGCFACRKMDAADAILHLDELSVFTRCSHPVLPLLFVPPWRVPSSSSPSFNLPYSTQRLFSPFPCHCSVTGLGQNYDNERALWLLHLLRIGRRHCAHGKQGGCETREATKGGAVAIVAADELYSAIK